jgi:hypothetical protein
MKTNNSIKIKNVWEKNPDFINEEGVKWWFELPYKGFQIWVIETPNGYKTRVILKPGFSDILGQDQTLDGVSSKIDFLNLVNLGDNEI